VESFIQHFIIASLILIIFLTGVSVGKSLKGGTTSLERIFGIKNKSKK
jgi:hypothetical protein